ncbi:GntR family transcriptional regulator [Aminivibrio sp.]|uniref:GntR family transcriptional regulator n=1 Tax=Aminivibrio sp. TaxID=1872489 RepID=UPI001A474D3B|nr:GntR family transcriptional regulator [Aminivibrio sp.]MBL3540474.1 GntR family transcriptional regulator [Aminivibrio sp.]
MLLKEKYKTKSGFVYELMREKIVSGEWPQGMNIIVASVARDLGVSAIPVREAMKLLGAEGLVVLEPHKGARVTEFDPEKIMEVMSVRGVLEGYAAAAALPFLDAETFADLHRRVEEMDDFVRAGQCDRFIAANKEFHRAIYSKGPFPLLNEMIFKLWDGGGFSHIVFAFRPERMEVAGRDHRAILESLEKNDGESAERLIREHKLGLARVLCAMGKKGSSDR